MNEEQEVERKKMKDEQGEQKMERKEQEELRGGTEHYQPRPTM